MTPVPPWWGADAGADMCTGTGCAPRGAMPIGAPAGPAGPAAPAPGAMPTTGTPRGTPTEPGAGPGAPTPWGPLHAPGGMVAGMAAGLGCMPAAGGKPTGWAPGRGAPPAATGAAMGAGPMPRGANAGPGPGARPGAGAGGGMTIPGRGPAPLVITGIAGTPLPAFTGPPRPCGGACMLHHHTTAHNTHWCVRRQRRFWHSAATPRREVVAWTASHATVSARAHRRSGRDNTPTPQLLPNRRTREGWRQSTSRHTRRTGQRRAGRWSGAHQQQLTWQRARGDAAAAVPAPRRQRCHKAPQHTRERRQRAAARHAPWRH